MNKYIKALSMVLVLTSSAFLSIANAASANSSNDMLITLAETNPILIERLNDIALNDDQLIKGLLRLADSDAVQLERLLNIAESDPTTFEMLVTIEKASTVKEAPLVEEKAPMMYSTFGTIKDGDLM